jgi:NADP-dependent 3-hydroxy acid dehydrogenase YdfG
MAALSDCRRLPGFALSAIEDSEDSHEQASCKPAVVTGAYKGFGAGVVKALTAEGPSIAVKHRSSKSGADLVVEIYVAELDLLLS